MPDSPPAGAAAALARFEQSAAQLASNTERFRRQDFSPVPLHRIEGTYLTAMAAAPGASPALRQAAAAVAAGRLRWSDVANRTDRPPEVQTLADLGVTLDAADSPDAPSPGDDTNGPPHSWLAGR